MVGFPPAMWLNSVPVRDWRSVGGRLSIGLPVCLGFGLGKVASGLGGGENCCYG